MTRCAIYARFSSDQQNPASADDQIRLCAEYAERQGWQVVGAFKDEAISGFTRANRPGLLNAVEAAERREFDVLLSEDEDRIARNVEDHLHVFNRLSDAGVRLATVKGEVDDLRLVFNGYMAEQYLKVLSAKTKRGMRANAEKGRATGARRYGYRSYPGGIEEIVEDEAVIVRRIFAAYAAGDSPTDIALMLNREGVPGPRGGPWNASTISGSNARGNGILNTEQYIGVKVWGRNSVRKDRRTGKRQHQYLPPEQWQRTPTPHLRIIDDETWAKTRERKQAARQVPEFARRQPTLFAGLLRCGLCGGRYTTYTTGKLICLSKKEGHGCTNRRTPNRAKVEKRILEGLREQMLSPEATEVFVQEYARAARERTANLAALKAPLIRRLGEVERRISRAVDAVLEGLASDSLKQKLAELEQEKLALAEQLAEADREPEPIAFHPTAAKRYAEMVAQLEATLPDAARGDTEAERRLKEAVRGLIDRVIITPLSQERGGEIEITIEGTLQSLLIELPEDARSARVVAGGGIEPPTCGL